MMLPPETIKARFDEKHIPEPNSGCWLWAGSTDSKGYGKMNLSGKIKVATHISVFLSCGAFPRTGEVVCHRCDNPYCVNPGHLFVGTQADNIKDMHRKGRAAIGDRMPVAKLTSKDIPSIRAFKESGIPQHKIAQIFGVSPMTISRIVNRQMWRHV